MTLRSGPGGVAGSDPSRRSFLFLTPHEARTVEAAMGRIVPDDDLGPGAVEAGAVHYVDQALAGAEQSNQVIYRTGVRLLDEASRSRFGTEFAGCAAADQDSILTAMEAGDLFHDQPPDGYAGWDQAWFLMLRDHTLEGMFADPVHGGNRGLAGWRLLGYPGPQPGYSHEEQQIGALIVRDRIGTAADFPHDPSRDG